jgi:hypothetical protein
MLGCQLVMVRELKDEMAPINRTECYKRSIKFVKAAFLCLAHALGMAMARVNSDPIYQSCRKEIK